MSIANTIDLHDAPPLTIEPREWLEYFPDTDHSAAPYEDTHNALDAYVAYDEGVLAEVPHALDAYLDQEQFSDM